MRYQSCRRERGGLSYSSTMCELIETPITESILHPNGCVIHYKRDDLLPYSFGGNKVRIAYEFLKDLKDKGCDTIVDYGSAKSNLSRVVANISTQLSGGYIITSYDDGESGEEAESFNNTLVSLCGVETRSCVKSRVAETVGSVLDEIACSGHKPYYIYGDKFGKGNERVPVMAYYRAYDEIRHQEEAQGLNFDYIFHASGTGMTQAGLVAGLAASCDERRIVGISVARSKERLESIISDSCRLFLCDESFDSSLVEVDDSHLCGGYGYYDEHVETVIDTVYRNDGVALDPCYTGKAFTGMLDYIEREGLEEQDILFIHTGGLPLFFDHLRR